MTRHLRRAALVVLCAVMSSSLLACGDEESPPGEKVPTLARQLDRIDEAIEAGDYAQAEAAVDELVAKTAQAQVKGDLSSEEADEILAAARAVLENLPGEDDDAEGDDIQDDFQDDIEDDIEDEIDDEG